MGLAWWEVEEGEWGRNHFYHLCAHHLFDDAGGLGGWFACLARDEHHLLNLDTVFELVFVAGHDCGFVWGWLLEIVFWVEMVVVEMVGGLALKLKLFGHTRVESLTSRLHRDPITAAYPSLLTPYSEIIHSHHCNRSNNLNLNKPNHTTPNYTFKPSPPPSAPRNTPLHHPHLPPFRSWRKAPRKP